MEFHDVSTTTGRIKQLISRLNWRWLAAGIFIVTFITVWVAAVENTSQPEAELLSLQQQQQQQQQQTNNVEPKNLLKASSNQITDKSKPAKAKPTKAPKKPGTFFFYGDGTSYFTDLDSTWLNKSVILELEIHNYFIDAASLTSSLEGYINLESINLETPGLSGQFSRVYLPKLKKFSFSIDAGVGVVEPYKDPMFLNSLLFFDTVQNSPPPLDLTSQLVQLNSEGVNVHVAAGHQTILEIRPSEGLLNLNLPNNCAELLKKLQENGKSSSMITQLVLSGCNLETDSGINSTSLNLPSSLKYLNLNQALPPTQLGVDQLMKQLKQNPGIQELHMSTDKTTALRPSLDVKDLPSQLQKLSVARMTLVTSSSGSGSGSGTTSTASVPSLTDLTLESCNVTGIVDNLEKIFPNLKSVALFQIQNTPDDQQYKLLNKILDNGKVDSVIVTGLVRNPNLMSLNADVTVTEAESSNGAEEMDQIQIERKLTSYNLGPTEQDFIISSNPRGGGGDGGGGEGTASNSDNSDMTGTGPAVRSAQALTAGQLNYRRFNLMGFNDMDEFDYYVMYDSGNGGKLKPELFVTLLITCMYLLFFINF